MVCEKKLDQTGLPTSGRKGGHGGVWASEQILSTFDSLFQDFYETLMIYE